MTDLQLRLNHTDHTRARLDVNDDGDFRLRGQNIEVTDFDVRGNIHDAESRAMLEELSGGDIDGARDRIAAAADDDPVRTSDNNRDIRTADGYEAPDAYTNGGRYTTAESADQVGLGMKGPEVERIQQQLADNGYDLGDTGSDGNGVDGFWGPKTQAAYEAYRADTDGVNPRDTNDSDSDVRRTSDRDRTSGPDDGLRGSDTEHGRTVDRLRNEDRDTYIDENPRTTARRLDNAMTETNWIGDPTPDTDEVAETLGGLRNEDMRDTAAAYERRTGDTIREGIAAMDDSPLGINDPFAIAGDNSDAIDLWQKQSDGRRLEGADAAADSPVTDELMQNVLRSTYNDGMSWNAEQGSWNGTNEELMNDVFARASGAQLQEMDRRLREGVTDSSGNRFQYDNGLEGLIKAEIGEGAHRDTLLRSLERPLR